MALADLLHDSIDDREELVARAHEAVERVMREKLADAFEQAGGDVQKALEAVVLATTDELTDLTSEAVRTGFDNARARRSR